MDKSTTFEKLMPEKKIRCADLVIEAGGGGINVSKALKELGEDSLAIFPSGGNNGERLKEILEKLDIHFRTIEINSDTRESFTAVELSSNAQYRFVMPGGQMDEKDVSDCLSLINDLNPLPLIIVASGSLSPGIPQDFFGSLAVLAKQKGIKLIVDTSGLPLKLAGDQGVYLLKPNLSELCSLVGKEFLELNEVDSAAKQVIEKGYCEVVVVSMGPAGAMLVTKDIHKRVSAPTVKKLSTVGAGDSMVAGIAFMLEKNASLIEAVQFGVSCGSAATMNPGTKLFNKDDVFRLYEWVKTTCN